MAPLEFAPLSGLGFLKSSLWWQKQWRLAWGFAPRCILPGLILGFANVIVVVTYVFVQAKMTSFNPESSAAVESSLTEVLGLLIVAIGVVLVSLLVSLIALSIWLYRLTEFAYVQLSLPAERLANLALDAGARKTAFDEAYSIIKGKRKFVFGVWLYATIFLLVPAFILSLFVAFEIVTGPAFVINGRPMIEVAPQWTWLHPFATSGSVLLGTMLLALLISTIVFSSVSTQPAFVAATEAAAAAFKRWPSVIVMALLVTVINTAISAPQVLLFFTPLPALVRGNPVIDSMLQLWLGLSSAVLWPLSLAPFCQALKQSCQPSPQESRE